MTCKPEGTHHNACDCREEYVKRLERVAEAAAKVPSFCCAHDECVYYPSDSQCHERLKEALQALRGSTNADKTEGK